MSAAAACAGCARADGLMMIGTTLGYYRIVEHLGGGGMGVLSQNLWE